MMRFGLAALMAATLLSVTGIANAQSTKVQHYSEWKTCTDGKWACNTWCEINKPGVVRCDGECIERYRQCLKDGTYWWGAPRGPLTRQ
jgi:hypothetical protein